MSSRKWSGYLQMNIDEDERITVTDLSVKEYEKIFFTCFDESDDMFANYCAYHIPCGTHMDYELLLGFRCPTCGRLFTNEYLCEKFPLADTDFDD